MYRQRHKMKSITRLFVCTVFVIALYGCYRTGSDLSASSLPKKSVVDIHTKLDIVPLLGKYEKIKIHLPYDWEVKEAKTYVGVQTKIIFTDLIKEFKVDTARYKVAFICKDGYSPIVPFDQLLMENGYLTVKDFDAKGDWDEAIQDKFSPAYLVWDLAIDDHQHSFPYGIVTIQFVEKKTEYLMATPSTNDTSILQGFSLFKERCIKCHTVNREGGTVGPELNFPKSVTEYWKIDQLKLFIKNPSDFRLNSKMPWLELNDAQIALIVDYLAFMSTHKAVKDN